MEITLNGKNALVTGGDRGIGAEVVAQLAAAGANVALHAREPCEKTHRAAEELGARHGVKVVVVSGDFNHAESVAELFEHYDEHFERIDILVNNAGYEDKYALEDLPFEKWNALIQVNLTTPFLCAQQAARRMKKSGGGVVINMQSIHDELMRKGVSHYSVAKAGLKMFSRAAGVEWGEYGIRVVGLSPGAIETDINRRDIDALGRDEFERWIPVGHVGETPDIGQTVVFLCSPQARYITATTLYVDGGYMHNVIRYDERPDQAGGEGE